MKDSEFVIEIKARLELESMGCKLIACPKCAGKGYFRIATVQTGDTGVLSGIYSCRQCDNRGYVWTTPNESIYHEKTVEEYPKVPMEENNLKTEIV